MPRCTSLRCIADSDDNLEFLADDIFEGSCCHAELADSFSKLFSCHGILVHHVSEFFLVERNLLEFLLCSIFSVQLLGNGLLALFHLLQVLGSDCQFIASCKLNDLALVTEGSTHYNSFVAKFLVIVVDLGNGLHTRIIFSVFVFLTSLSLVPVHNTAHKGRDQGCADFCTGDRLSHAKQQSHVDVDALLFEYLCSLNALPRAGDLDQHLLCRVYSAVFVHLDEGPSLSNSCLAVEGETRIDLGTYNTRDDLRDFNSEIHSKSIHRQSYLCFLVSPLSFSLCVLHSFSNKIFVLWQLAGAQDERRVGGSIDRLVGFDSLDVTGVGYDLGVLKKRFELISFGHF
mmetsp:Transcript_16341/g.22907  ORF Transcript_16341/g.22907 Transcript_16341/m.22907 type:complete len:343 (+) Transcript_16341:131-1159(+)